MINSEIGRLKQVLVHKPIYALSYLTPQNCRHYLFDDVLWVERALQEHDAFVEQMRAIGVDVLLLHTLLEETLALPAARAWLVDQRLQALGLPVTLVTALQEFLLELPAVALTEVMLGGLLRQQCKALRGHLAGQLVAEHDAIIPPLPNQLYVRDSSCWIGHGLVLAAMKFSVRRGEVLNLAAIYRFHPRLQQRVTQYWFEGGVASLPASLEGGDVLVLTPRTVMIGISQRTTPSAIETLAQRLLTESAFEQVIAIELPDARRYMHLDVVMTMVRQDTFVCAMPVAAELRAWQLRRGAQAEVVVEAVTDLAKVLAQALAVTKVHFIQLEAQYHETQREQWTAAANLLTLAPGEVIAYDRNVAMNRQLKQAGLVVHEIASAELSRGRGGARCMSCPLEREEV